MLKKFQIVLFGIFVILSIYVKSNPVISWDLLISQSLQGINYSWFDSLMKFITQIGNRPYEFMTLILVGLYLYLIKRKKEAVILFFSTAGIFFISSILKMLIARPRPDPNLVIQVNKLSGFDSFPSGHVLFAMGFYGFIFLVTYKSMKKGYLKNLLLISCILIIILMGLSRIYLGAHWFTDTLGSYLIGTMWLYLMSLLLKRLKSF